MSNPEKISNLKNETAGLLPWMPDEYETGYRARYGNASEFRTATPCWRVGWQEAEQELAWSDSTRVQFLKKEALSLLSCLDGTGTGWSAHTPKLPSKANRSASRKRSWTIAKRPT